MNILKKGFYFALFINIMIFLFNLFMGGNLTNIKIDSYFQNKDIPRPIKGTINLTPTQIIASIIVILIIVILLGINVLGSGLGSTSVQLASKLISFIGIWLIISIFTYSTLIELNQLGYNLGYYFFWILTIMYALGILNNIMENKSMED